MATPLKLQMLVDVAAGHDATYPDIRAVFWVASSQNTEDLFELPLGGDIVDIYVVFVRCHYFNIIVSRTQKTQKDTRSLRENSVDLRLFRAGVWVDVTWRKWR